MRKKAQSTIEFTLAFVCTMLFFILTCNLFVWLNHCLVARQAAYGDTRTTATSTAAGDIGDSDFFDVPELNVFSAGGYD